MNERRKKCADNRKVSHSCICVSHCCVPGLLCKYLTLRHFFFHSMWLEIKKISTIILVMFFFLIRIPLLIWFSF